MSSKNYISLLPVQVKPSPLKPSLHTHSGSTDSSPGEASKHFAFSPQFGSQVNLSAKQKDKDILSIKYHKIQSL